MSGHDLPSAADLSVLQHWFQSVITHPEGVAEGLGTAGGVLPVGAEELERILTRSSRLSAAERLAVYANAYHARLIECLGEVFPLVRRVVGEAGFSDFAVEYLQEFPSRSYTLNSLGKHFADFLNGVRPERVLNGIPDWADFVIELALFEWELFEVFDGPGTEGLSPFKFDALGGVPPERWDEIRLQPAPSLRLLKFQFPLNEFFSAARALPDGELLVAPEPKESLVALTRRGYVVRRHALSVPEFELLSTLKSGVALGAALAQEVIARPCPDGGVQSMVIRAWFSRWSREEFFIGYSSVHSG